MEFREQHMHAPVAAHGLRHAQIADQGAQHGGLIPGKVGPRADLVHHLAAGATAQRCAAAA